MSAARENEESYGYALSAFCMIALSKRSDMQISSNALGYLGNEKATAESFQDGYFVVRLQEAQDLERLLWCRQATRYTLMSLKGRCL